MSVCLSFQWTEGELWVEWRVSGYTCGYNFFSAGLSTSVLVFIWIRFLLEYGVDVNARDDDGNTALYYAQQDGANKIAKWLEAQGGMV